MSTTRKTLRAALATGLVAVAMTGLAVTESGTASAASSRTTIEGPQPDPFPFPIPPRMPSRFGMGSWFDMGSGNLFVAAPLEIEVPLYGWAPDGGALVQVQERLRHGRWVVRATLRTNRAGVAWHTLPIGGGIHYLRVVHRADARSTATVGRTRRVVITTEPFDVN